jgi:hypothetical protein
MTVVFVLLLGVVSMGSKWWNSDAKGYDQNIYKPLVMQPKLLEPGRLQLAITDPGWLEWRKVDDFILDHNHLMHLYAIRDPGMDVVFHLHPEMKGSGMFELHLPDMPAGHYRLYADVVHEDGFAETLSSSLDIPAISGRPLEGDDAVGKTRPLSEVHETTNRFTLPDGYQMVWENGANGPLRAKQPAIFKFKLLDPKGNPPADMAFYMGMLGHAAFFKKDGSVFAHIHPNGTVAMAALMMAEQQTSGQPAAMAGMNMSDMPQASQAQAELPNEVGFPYGFPVPGRYRIVVQMKHGATVETAVFDAVVSPSQKSSPI